MDLFLKIYNDVEYRNAFKEGKKCVTREDRKRERHMNNFGFDVISLRGCKDLAKHLKLDTATGFLDQGCGTGQVLLYAFLMFPNLINVYGIELLKSRFEICKKYISKIQFMGDYKIIKNTTTEFVISDGKRNIYLSNCSMYDYKYDYKKIDAVLSNVCVCDNNKKKYTCIINSFSETSILTFIQIGNCTPIKLSSLNIRLGDHRLFLSFREII